MNKSTLVSIIFALVAALAIYIAFTKEPIHIIDTTNTIPLEQEIDSLNTLISNYEQTSDSLIIKNKESDSIVNVLKAEIAELKKDKEDLTVVIQEQSLKEDSLYFALKSGHPVEILPDSNIKITPMQLKYANINIAQNISGMQLISKLESTVDQLTVSNVQKDSLIQTQQAHLLAEQAKSKRLEAEHENDVKKLEDQKKEEKKSKKNSFFKGALAGAIVVLVAVLAN